MPVSFDLAPQDWQTLRRLLDEALTRPPAERAAWIERLDSSFEAFKPRLRALLAHAADSPALAALDTLPKIETAQFLSDRPPRGGESLPPGAGVGPYRLIRPLGEGGMGSVWLAERTDMLHKRQVALKLPRILTGRAALEERLAREREILAALNHPNIARLYDAGIAADGQPYLALEYVDGERIDAYCRRKHLGVPARLRLFLQVARAVAHAHANLVVHRDLKPSNILVTEEGEVRLLDFGIAKLLDDGHAQDSELTQLVGRALTPDYAAPEQILGQPISTATDIYSLGVVLFELLAGARPYRLKRDSRAALEEAIVQAEPGRPSAVVAEPKLRRALRGDLDTIVLKALKKPAAERYATVDALAEDIERHLGNRPVQAQPDSRFYRVRKFAARNRLPVAAAGSLLIAIVTGAAIAAWQAQIAISEKRRADEVKEFIAAIFRDADPWAGPGKALSALALLQQARTKVERSFLDRPELRVELLSLLIASFNGLQDYASSEAIAQLAIRDASRLLGENHRLTLQARALFTSVQRFRGTKVPAADLDLLLTKLKKHAPGAVEAQLEVLKNRAHFALDQGRNEDAIVAADEALAFASANFPANHRLVVTTRLLTAVARQQAGQHERALPLAEEAQREVIRYFEGNRKHPSAIDARGVYARALGNAGRLTEAIAELTSVVEDVTAVIGEAAPMAGYYSADAALYMLRAGDVRGALAYSERAARILTASAAPGSLTHGAALALRGTVLMAARREAEALPHLQEALGSLGSILEPSHPRLDALRVSIALAAGMQGNTAKSIAALKALATELRSRNARQASVAWTAQAILLRLSHQPHLALEALELASRLLPEAPVLTMERRYVDALTLLVRLDLSQSDELLDEVARLSQSSSPFPANPIEADRQLASARARMLTHAAKSALGGFEAVDRFWSEFDPSNRGAGEAAYWLGKCYAALGRGGDAKQAFARAVKILSNSPLPSDARLARLARAG